ncbi:MAG TPA: type II 3-dehydroquinate dehydratase, partial [Oscillospiraceae bacterium]|nr:type II 3-dehydroquinate dehydratase [Oscillospiraceae bacterium]
YRELVASLYDYAEARGLILECRQTNHEGVLVDWIQEARGRFDGIVINPGAYTHTSVALLDAVRAAGVPTVEVHLSDVEDREAFRKISYVGMACVRTIKGMGFAGYIEAIRTLEEYGK